MTIHNEANLGDIAKTVLMPGDPLRAKYIAENFLENAKLINSVRNMLGYTGTYKGKELTVFASGMGMPSMGIYSFELYKYYDVENIIRIGSCGGYTKELNLFDTILVNNSYTEGNFAFNLNAKKCDTIASSEELNNIIEATSKESDIKVIKGNVFCSEVFDYYADDKEAMIARLPKEKEIIACEMESFALFYTANYLNKKASCLLTVVDSHYHNKEVSVQDREKSLNDMIKLALESAVKI